MMKLKYKHWHSNEWKTTSSFKVLEKEIAKLSIGVCELIEIKRVCSHKDTFIVDGIKTCKICSEQLEVTSY